MKLLFFDDFKLGVVKGNNVVDVTSVVNDIPHLGPGDLMNSLIGRWAEYKGKIDAAVAAGSGVPLSGVRIRPPLPKPVNIDCMAVNYMENGTRAEPSPINAFLKTSNTIIGNGDTMILPDEPVTVFEGEAELALVVGKHADQVKAADAWGYIFGYTNFVDGSARGLQPGGFFYHKSFKTFAPIGPYVVTADEVAKPQNLHVQLWNSGKLMQDYNTDDMGHKIARCIEFISSIHPLEPGDIIALGTNHRGLHPFMDGDRIEMETEGLGRLTFNVKDDLKRTWVKETHLERETKGLPGGAPQTGGKYTPVATA